MKKAMAATLFAAAAIWGAPAAAATPDMCAGHADYADLPNGAGFGNTYITACGGDGGPDYANNAQTPDVDSGPQGGVDSVASPSDSGYVDSGSNDETQNQKDEDGIQGHDNVRTSPLYVPGGVS